MKRVDELTNDENTVMDKTLRPYTSKKNSIQS